MKAKIEIPAQIDLVMRDLDAYATNALNNGRVVTIEYADDAATKKQLDSMHLWFSWCEKHLNSVGAHRKSNITGKEVPWTTGDFKQCVYKPFLKAWKGKSSTKDQTTKDPEEIRLAISGHLATYYGVNICLPEWPSLR